MDGIEWLMAIQHKRQQWVGGLALARERANEQLEQALTTLMTQVAEFEREYLRLQREGIQRDAMLPHLADNAKKQWPELWATMDESLDMDNPDLWVANHYVVVGIEMERMPDPATDTVSIESRINQLETLHLSEHTLTVLDTVIQTWQEHLRQALVESQGTMKQWEYAALLYQLGRYGLATCARVYAGAFQAIRQAEEAGELLESFEDPL
jgi:hypothetical protein